MQRTIGVYRFLAFFWLFIGLALLILPEIYPDLKERELMANHVAMAGFCFALSMYNMIRWRLIRARQLEMEREREESQRRNDTGRPIDPNFDFSDAPPKEDKS
ncbi:MAG TPA: hypothetical protein VFE62_12535 [Gemmataceae bacterium]|nr:hypothetical protein [Gemmataceae bacterium]